MPTLTLERVTKRYGSKVAVNQISFEAQSGRVLGLLGPNGAGKTSTIRMITYITTPDEGEIRLNDKVVGPWSQERMGYLPEERGLYKKLKVLEQLIYFAELKGMKRSDALAQIEYWLDRFEASGWKSKKTQELSKGMQQKVQFISTILHNPDLLILDEPFSGLDPINTELLQSVIQEQKSMNRILLFASHRMEQVEQLCDDICLISDGSIVLQGSIREVKQQFGRNRVILEFEGNDAFLDELVAESLVTILHRTATRAELRLINGTPPGAVLEKAVHRAGSISRFEPAEPSLNEIFMTVVEEAKEKSAPPLPETSPLAS